MARSSQLLFTALLATASLAAHAQAVQTVQAVQTTGTLVVIPASGEITLPNDEAHATLNVEEQDKDKAKAASRVNEKMNQGIDIVKKMDPKAQLKTRGYYTYAVYAEDTPRSPKKQRAIVGWRVGQYLDVTTGNLAALPKTISAVQSVLGLNNLNFGLSPASVKKLDAALINATYKNLNDRIGAIAAAMGRQSSDAVIDTVDFEGSGNYARPNAQPKAMMMRSAVADMESADAVAEPSFEPGESTVGMNLVGKVRFK